MAGSVGAIPLINLGCVASEVITKYRFVKLDGEQSIDLGDTEGEECHGVALEDADADDVTAGKVVGVQFEGFAILEAAAAITIMQDVMSSANGRAMAVADGGYVMGRAWTTAAAPGDLMVVQLMPSGLGRADYQAPLALTCTNPVTNTEGQAIHDKLNAVIAALIAAGLMDAS